MPDEEDLKAELSKARITAREMRQHDEKRQDKQLLEIYMALRSVNERGVVLDLRIAQPSPRNRQRLEDDGYQVLRPSDPDDLWLLKW